MIGDIQASLPHQGIDHDRFWVFRIEAEVPVGIALGSWRNAFPGQEMGHE